MNEIISLINNVDLKDESAYPKLFEIFSQSKQFPIFDVKILINKYVYRARENNGKRFVNFSELSNPPIECVTTFGRANKPSQSVFYCSDSWITPITELMPLWYQSKNAGDKFLITISEWKVIKELNVILIPDFYNDKMNPFTDTLQNKENISNEQLTFLYFINQTFRKDTSNDKHIYKVTSAFCNILKMYYEKCLREKMDGVLYTSVQDKIGWNLALEEHVIKERMIILDRVFEQIIEKTNKKEYNNYIEPNSCKELDFENKKIIWSD